MFAFQRKFSFVTSLKDFAQYFDCLDDVAFISIGPHEYYKVTFQWAWPVGRGLFGRGHDALVVCHLFGVDAERLRCYWRYSVTAVVRGGGGGGWDGTGCDASVDIFAVGEPVFPGCHSQSFAHPRLLDEQERVFLK